MSRYTVGVILPKEVLEDEINEYTDKALKPFSFYNCSSHENNKEENVLCVDNTNLKWDWYKIGGRWDNLIETKDGSNCNYARIKDILFEKKYTEDRLNKIKSTYEILISEGDFYTSEYYQKKYPTFETYLKDRNFKTYALLNSKGEWLEPGKMGYFGISYSSIEEQSNFTNNYLNYIKDEDENNWLVVVDCHI